MDHMLIAHATAVRARLLDSAEYASKDGIPDVASVAENAIDHLMAAHIQGATFFNEVSESVDRLSSIADEHGARTLADLMALHAAINSHSFIDYYPGQSSVLDLVKALPSGEKWASYIRVQYLADLWSPVQADPSLTNEQRVLVQMIAPTSERDE